MRSDKELLDFLASTKGTLACVYGGDSYPNGWELRRRVPKPPNVAQAPELRDAIDQFMTMEAAPPARRSLL